MTKDNHDSREVAAAANDEANIEPESHVTENSRKESKEFIAREVKSAIKELATKKMVTTVREMLDGFLPKASHTMQCDAWYVVYKVMEQVMLDLLCTDVIGETLHAMEQSFSAKLRPPKIV